jgi:hypothetical protein
VSGTRTVPVFYLPEDPETASPPRSGDQVWRFDFGIFVLGLTAWLFAASAPPGGINKQLKTLMLIGTGRVGGSEEFGYLDLAFLTKAGCAGTTRLQIRRRYRGSHGDQTSSIRELSSEPC